MSMAKPLRSFSPQKTSSGCTHNTGCLSVSRGQDGVDYRNEDIIKLMNTEAKNASSTSASCGAAVTNSPTAFSDRPHFSFLLF